MEDLDSARVVPNSADQILRDLEWLGIDWDGTVEYQSQRHDLYQDALATLKSKQRLYACFCSRKELKEIASAPHGKSVVYPGRCRQLSSSQIKSRSMDKSAATRFAVDEAVIEFTDGLLGQQRQDLAREVGDFVVSRADGVIAYHLAVVVDDLEQSISHVVRGADLLDSTARQLLLAKVLQPEALPVRYCHVPLMLDEVGIRMAKRDGSDSLQQWKKSGQSVNALVIKFANDLGFSIPANVRELSAKDLLETVTLDDFRHALLT